MTYDNKNVCPFPYIQKTEISAEKQRQSTLLD